MIKYKPIIKKSKIADDVVFGKNVTVIEPVNLYGCVIGDNCFIGPFTEIQRGAWIGDNCRIQSHSFICEGVYIATGCFISHGVKFINDNFKLKHGPSHDPKLWKETFIGCNVSIGTNATILPVKIVRDTVIGAGSVVAKDIEISGVYAGNPAKLIKKYEDRRTK